jgi:hypothetical protein
VTLDWLYNRPSWLFALLSVGGWIVLSVGGMLITRRSVPRVLGERWERNDVVGYYLNAVGVFYGIALGLIAVGSWQNHSDVDSRISLEAATIGALRSDIRSFPAPYDTQLGEHLNDYVEFVIHCAWTSHAQGQVAKAGEYLKPFREQLNTFEPKNLGQSNLQAEAMRQYNEILRLKRLRDDAPAHGLPAAVWVVVLFGGLLNLVLTWLFVITPLRVHVILNTMIAAVIGLLIFLIAAMDAPFRGSLQVTPAAFTAIDAGGHEAGFVCPADAK